MRLSILLFACVVFLPPLFADDGSELVGDALFEALAEKVRPSVATIKVNGRDGDQIQMGTGFVIDSGGLIATNFHVINEGRPFTVEMASGRTLPVVSVEASDRSGDLALVRVDVKDEPLPALPLSDAELRQGVRVLAFGNPLGLRHSVVAGIVSAVREVEDQKMIQLAMPIEQGNSGGPLVDLDGKVRGIINMKSAIDDNLGFAIPIGQLSVLREHPNPVIYDRWVRLGRIDENKWSPIFGASWQQRGGLVTARGVGNGFGGRSLCLSTEQPPGAPIEIAVDVRLNDESGAAGLAFHCDGGHRHYGFYPSNGRMRLTCFKGPSVYSWQILDERESEHYLPRHWNRLRVRIEPDRFQCFVNGHLVIESTDRQLAGGKFGLVKFRNTNPDFKSFQFGPRLATESMSAATEKLLGDIISDPDSLATLDTALVSELGRSPDVVSRRLQQRAIQLQQQAEQITRLASDVQLAPTLDDLAELMADDAAADRQLLRGAVLIAKLDNPEVDVDAYLARVADMASEVRQRLPEDADAIARREALHRYLFDENGFHGGRAEYYHPANSYLNRVIDDREGLPITLSILYMELGKQLGLTIEGVGLPGHFVVKHRIDDGDDQLIDVFEQGQLLSTDEARQIVATYAGRAMRESDLRGQSVAEILLRVVNNLIGIARRQPDTEAIHRYCEALVAIDPESIEYRMMRSQARVLSGRRGAAVEDLDWLIENDPPGFDRTAAMRLRQTLIQQTD